MLSYWIYYSAVRSSSLLAQCGVRKLYQNVKYIFPQNYILKHSWHHLCHTNDTMNGACMRVLPRQRNAQILYNSRAGGF